MLAERKIYEIHRLSVHGWRRRGQISVEVEGWRDHEADWFKAMRSVRLEISDPALPGSHSEKAHYFVSESAFKRKIVESVDERGSTTSIQLREGTLDITETWRPAWQRQAAEVLSMGLKYLLLPLLTALIAGLGVWWIDRLPKTSSHDSAIPESSAENRVYGSIDDSVSEPSDRSTSYPATETLPELTGIDGRDSTNTTPKGSFSTEGATGDGKEERTQESGTNPANPELEGHPPEIPSSTAGK